MNAYIFSYNFFFNYSVSKSFFKRQIEDIAKIIRERQLYYDELMKNFEVYRIVVRQDGCLL